jgi:hypothetical protein
MPRRDESLWGLMVRSGNLPDSFLRGVDDSVALAELVGRSSLDCALDELAGRAILVATEDQLTAALTVIELDGVARRLVLCPPGVSAGHISQINAAADIDLVVFDGTVTKAAIPDDAGRSCAARKLAPAIQYGPGAAETSGSF